MLVWEAFDRHPVDALVTTRHGGVSTGPYATLNLSLGVGDTPEAVLENRRRAAAAVGAGLDDLVFAEQVHGAAVARVDGHDRGRGASGAGDAMPGADALVTTDPSVVLAVLVADCVPIVLYDPRTHTVACVHAGWRGTVGRVARATVEVMATMGARPHDLVAGIGPAISGERYEVGEEVADAARAGLDPPEREPLTPQGEGRWRFDLRAANRRILEGAGLRPERISVVAASTGDGAFFSHRSARPTGRFALLARLARG